MTDDTSRVASLAVLVAVLAALAVGGATAAFVTGGDLAGDGTDTVTGFEAGSGNDTIQYNTSTSSDTLNDFDTLKLEVKGPSGAVHATYTQSEATVVSGGSDATNGLEVEFAVERADLDSLPGAPGETTNATFEVTEIDTNGNEFNDTAEVGYTFSDNRSVLYPTSASDSSALSLEEPPEPGIFGSFQQSVPDSVPFLGAEQRDSDIATIDTTRSVNGSQTDIVVFDAGNSNVSDSFEEAAEGYTSSGDPVLGTTLTVDGNAVPVFYESADTDVVNTSADTYAVYDGDKTTVYRGDEYDGASSVDVFMEAQDPLESSADVGINEVGDIYGGLESGQVISQFGVTAWAASWEIPSLSVFGGSLLFGFGIPLGYKRRQEA